MSDKTKKQFYFCDKPIDLADITPLETEYTEKAFSPEPKEITMSFDCEMSEETADWFKSQMDELNKEEKKLEDLYVSIAKYNADNLFPSLFKSYLPENKDSDDKAKELLSAIIFSALCKGWNDCFDINVKHEKQQTTL